jgi:hypothetical protein
MFDFCFGSSEIVCGSLVDTLVLLRGCFSSSILIHSLSLPSLCVLLSSESNRVSLCHYIAVSIRTDDSHV